MKIERNTIKFSSGRERNINAGIIGLDACGTPREVTHGYDGQLWGREESEYLNDPLTAADLVELADHMIAAWQAFRATQL